MISTPRTRRPRLETVRRQLDRWRQKRRHARAPLPARLWAAAVALVPEHGVYGTARALRLSYGALKQHVDATTRQDGDHVAPDFIELPPPPADAPPSTPGDAASGDLTEPRCAPRRRGHGRHAADAYGGAPHVAVPHAQLHHGDRCPRCSQGKVYPQRDPGLLIRLMGQPPISGTIYELEKLRCNLCGEVFTAHPPAGVGPEQYDPTTGAMIALLKYGTGMPFHRLERLQADLQIPLPASTQWEVVDDLASRIRPILGELMRQAANGEVVHNDDTSMTVLDLKRPGAPRGDPDDVSPDRTGVFTSGIVATRDGHRVALFVTGRRHAGENLARILADRTADLGPPIQMCDALSRNLPKPLAVIVGHCLAHARRHVVEVAASFPAECRRILEALGTVYRHDAEAREQGLSPEARLTYHQMRSGPVLADLHAWLTVLLADHLVEPNSSLGQATRTSSITGSRSRCFSANRVRRAQHL